MSLNKEMLVKIRSVFRMLAMAFALCLAFLGIAAPATAQSICGATGTIPIDSGRYIYQQDEWNSTLKQCATVSGAGFTLTTANFNTPSNGGPATYPSIFRGCHWGICTSSNPFPIKESEIASASTSVSITQPSGLQNDAAYDIWFNQAPAIAGQPDGTEIMIWINHQGAVQPAGSRVAEATIDGAKYDVWIGAGSSWKIVSYVAATPVTSVKNLNLLPFFADSISRGSLKASWYLIDVEFGFEVWSGGNGLAVSGFSVSAAAVSGKGGSASAAAALSLPASSSRQQPPPIRTESKI